MTGTARQPPDGGTGPDSPGAPSVPAARAVLEEADVARALTRIVHEILERTGGARETVLMGIPTRGVYLARRLADRVEQFEGRRAPAGSLDITMHRDDLRLRPPRALEHTDLPGDGIDGKRLIVVDDVLFSGRTVRAALDALSDLGRPGAVQLAVLVDRGHRELPIRADYVGKNLPTSLRETVRVLCREIDERDAVLLGDAASAPDPSAGTAPGEGVAADQAHGRAGSGSGGGSPVRERLA